MKLTLRPVASGIIVILLSTAPVLAQAVEFCGVAKSFFQQGEIADEAARVCLDSGDLDSASKWYQTGHDTGLKEPGIKPLTQVGTVSR